MFQRTLLPSIVIIIVIISLIATAVSNNHHVQAFHQSSANNKYTKFAFAPAFVTTGTTTTITTPNTRCLFFSRTTSRPCRRALSHHSLSSSSSSSSGVVLESRDELVRIASSLVSDSPTGLFLTLPSDRSKFMRAVARLEALAAIPDSVETFESDCIGDWILLATSRKDPLLDPLLSSISGAGSRGSAGSGDSYDSSSSTSTPLSIRKLDPKLRNSLCVIQRIRATRSDDAPNTVDRIDNVIEFNNAKTKLLPEFLNPLQIDKSKLVLIHKARVESSSPVFRIRLALNSIVLNLAGQSRNLDPMGKDVLGLNVNLPFLNEWMVNSGEFETTYVDQEVRVSRGTIGFLEETRVFVRQNGMFDTANATTTSGSTNATQEQEPSQLGNVVAAVEEVADAVGNLTKSIKATVERDVEYMKEDMETSLEDLKNVVQEDFKGVQKAVDKVKSAVLGDEKLEKAVDVSVEAVSKLGEDVQEAVREDVEDLKKTVEEDMENVQSALEGVKDVVTGDENEDEKAQDTEKDIDQK